MGGRELGTTSPLFPLYVYTQESERGGVVFLCLVVMQPHHRLEAFLDCHPVFLLEVLPCFSSFLFFNPVLQMDLPEITLGVLSNYYLLSEQLKEVLWYTGGKELGTL